MLATMVAVTEAKKKPTTIMKRVQHQGESYIITRYGEPAAALAPVNAYEIWHRCQRKACFDLVRDLQKEADLSPKEADRVVGDAVAAVGAEG